MNEMAPPCPAMFQNKIQTTYKTRTTQSFKALPLVGPTPSPSCPSSRSPKSCRPSRPVQTARLSRSSVGFPGPPLVAWRLHWLDFWGALRGQSLTSFHGFFVFWWILWAFGKLAHAAVWGMKPTMLRGSPFPSFFFELSVGYLF